MNKDVKARNAVEHVEKSKPLDKSSGAGTAHAPDHSPAGPHSKDHLTDHEKTPGSGTLTDQSNRDNVDPGTG